MRTLDRYIIRNFLFAAMLWFVVLMSLRTVIDLFINMDEFAKLGRFRETMGHVASYYGYQSLAYLNELGGVVIVAAAAFTLARMNQTNELTAMLASGVSLYRVVWPIIICAMILCGVIILDREVAIPRVADKLVRRRDDVPGTRSFSVYLTDDESGAVWYSPVFSPSQEVMESPLIVIRDNMGRWLADIRGKQAHPGVYKGMDGWFVIGAVIVPDMSGGQVWVNTPKSERVFTSLDPREIREMLPADGDCRKLSVADPGYGDMRTEGIGRLNQATGEIELINPSFTFAARGVRLGTICGSWAVLHPGRGRDGYWELKDGQLFFPSDLSTEDLVLRRARRWQAYLSVGQLTKLLKLKQVTDPDSVRLLIQSRVTDPINNLLMLLIGLPFILSRERNIKSSASLCLLTVMTFYAFIYICRYMGLPPMLAAWLPILLFGPIVAVMFDAIRT
jgi:lipopolysaccharide export LptBFGC system permease protein LptF